MMLKPHWPTQKPTGYNMLAVDTLRTMQLAVVISCSELIGVYEQCPTTVNFVKL